MAGYEWKCVTENAAFAGRDGAGAVVLNDNMWLLGGWNPNDKVNFPQICNSEGWCSSDGETWTEVGEQAPWEGEGTLPDMWCTMAKCGSLVGIVIRDITRQTCGRVQTVSTGSRQLTVYLGDPGYCTILQR